MEQKTYQVWVRNTFTNKYELCAVTKEQYDAFRRTGWNIEDNNASFRAHQTVFTDLRGGSDGAFENFHALIENDDSLLKPLLLQEQAEALHCAIAELSGGQREVIELLYFHVPPLSAAQVGSILGITERAVNKRRRKAEEALYKKMKEF